jgi:hypothetical protein
MARWVIDSKPKLVAALHEACEVEHQLMTLYLYAAFSLKKDTDAALSAAQLEAVRRWASVVYMVARQEMEHLSLACSLLTAIGERPWFARQNIGREGLLLRYFHSDSLARKRAPAGHVPRDLPLEYRPFDETTISRMVCMESPAWNDVPDDLKPTWCFLPPGVRLREGTKRPPMARTHIELLDAAARRQALGAIEPRAVLDLVLGQSVYAGLIQELYGAIREAIVTLPDLFVGNPTQQVQIPVEYNIFVFPVTDQASAVRAIDQILREGEGLDAQPGYESHFRRFYDVRAEYLALASASRGPFEPGLPLLINPMPDEIHEPFAVAAFELFNEAYATMVLMLDALYSAFVPESQERYPHFSTTLQQATFAPVMTMVIRSLAEILVRVPIDAAGRRTGPNFWLGPEDEALLRARTLPPQLADVEFFLERWQRLVAGSEALAAAAPPGVRQDAAFLEQNVKRISANVRQVYQAGKFRKF